MCTPFRQEDCLLPGSCRRLGATKMEPIALFRACRPVHRKAVARLWTQSLKHPSVALSKQSGRKTVRVPAKECRPRTKTGGMAVRLMAGLCPSTSLLLTVVGAFSLG
mmetsp:Transcript_42780/g.59426  ORF Transcript_42780/g.59426 Transcript_42780/m.59426 type:complete len:107 (+) Transcript_42780:217-537(+)